MKNTTVKGKVLQVVGPIVDVTFKDQHLPELLTALEIPLSLYEKIQEESKRTCLGKSAIVRLAIIKYFDNLEQADMAKFNERKQTD